MAFPTPLNKFEKEKKVIELHKQGKTLRHIASEVLMSFRDISKIIKVYDKQTQLQQNKKGENNQSPKIKRRSKNCLAYELFLSGKNAIQVSIDLNLDFQKARNYWKEYLQLKNMKRLYNIFIENEFHLDYLFKIDSFLLRNNIPIEDMNNVLSTAYDITKLFQTQSNMKAEIEKLKQIRNNMQYSQNYQLAPIRPLPQLFNWNYYRQHY